ncbi:peptidyl-prolyl cis-trans isomerase FKBP19, chloroplastic isoform X2 [Morus notabilis]|uniref:peptidyl-prolyl cis-trans isomerase FKBP19, chloroplastic isoform X2 n=1 Tax=Morus notabilis TaxID=981085 RepID=UPI000CECE48F|nr:peptidyl-prolyl cis-trans isomerase FKBP19, chloroplastic isoform X2 [Morus notabilis]
MDALHYFQANMACRHNISLSSSSSSSSLSTPKFLSAFSPINLSKHVNGSRKEMRGIVRPEMLGQLKTGLESALNKLKKQDFRRSSWEADVLSPQSVGERGVLIERRNIVILMGGIITGALWNASKEDGIAAAAQFADMPAIRGKDYGKTKMRYPDYTETESGLQYKDLRLGDGPGPKRGDTVVVDWDGYTIGYYGRIFEARNKTKGGSFEGDDKDFFKFRVGSQEVIPAFEEAVSSMALGGIRRIIVPPELGYPENDFNKSGPRPTTFSGQRALDFVLKNQGLIDKTLLFDIELLKIIPN